MNRYLEIFYWEIPCFHLKMTIHFLNFLSYCVVKYISIGHYRSFLVCVRHIVYIGYAKVHRVMSKQKKTSDSALGQSKSTKTININSIRIMRIIHYRWVSKSVNSIMPCDEQFLLWGKINPHRNQLVFRLMVLKGGIAV